MFHQGQEVSLPTLFPTQVSPVDLRHLSKDSFSGPISRSLETRFCGSRRSAIWAIVEPLVSCHGYPSSTYHIISMGTSPLRSQKPLTGQTEGLLSSHLAVNNTPQKRKCCGAFSSFSHGVSFVSSISIFCLCHRVCEQISFPCCRPSSISGSCLMKLNRLGNVCPPLPLSPLLRIILSVGLSGVTKGRGVCRRQDYTTT